MLKSTTYVETYVCPVVVKARLNFFVCMCL